MKALVTEIDVEARYRSNRGAVDTYEATLEAGELVADVSPAYGIFEGRFVLFLANEPMTSYLAPKGWDPERDLVEADGRAA